MYVSWIPCMFLCLSLWQGSQGLECFTCNQATHSHACSESVLCHAALNSCETMFEKVGGSGQLMITKRCIPSSECPPQFVNECNGSGRICRYCCNTDRCNAQLFYSGPTSYPPTQSTSPIKGERGDTGPPGRDGRNGIVGRPGYPGPPGSPGEPGLPGERGYDGSPGRKGEKGEPGISGMDGLPVINGMPGLCDVNSGRKPRSVPVAAFTVFSSNVVNDKDWTLLPIHKVITNLGCESIVQGSDAVFQAPVPGLYKFLVTTIANGDEATPVYLFHNQTKVAQTSHPDVSEEAPMSTATAIVNMEVGDNLYAKLRPKQPWSLVDRGYSSYSDITFSGYLMHPSQTDEDEEDCGFDSNRPEPIQGFKYQ